MKPQDTDLIPPALETLSAAEKRALLTTLLAERRERPLIRPVSFGQRRLWFFEQLEQGTSVFHLPFTLRLTGPLSEEALDRALSRLSERHETLRTAFAVIDEQPVQVVTATPIRTLVVRDLRAMSEVEREREVERLTTGAAEVPFDLSKAPLWRAELLKVRDDEHLLLFTIHHLIADGWSIVVFLRDLSIAYQAGIDGTSPGWAPLPMQYGDVAQLQQHPDYESRMSEQLAFWQQQLSGRLPVLHLPSDAPRPPIQTYRAGRVSAVLGASIAGRIKAAARRSDSTLFMALLAAFQVVLWRLSGERDVIVGAPVAGRTRAEEEDVIGLFINTVGLRTLLDPEASFAQLLEHVKRGARSAYANADVPFDRVVQSLQLQRDQSRSPVFQVLFNLLGFRPAPQRLGPAGMEVRWALERSAKFDLTLYAREEGAEIAVELVYNADLFEPARMEAFAAQFSRVVEQVGVNPDVQLSAISLVDAGARAVLPNPEAPLPERPAQGSVLTRLQHWSRMTPNAVAVIDARERWSYAELEARSSRVASGLAREGIGPGAIVAIYAHRSAGLLAATMGVWKSGAAFFVLDPAQPQVRLAAFAKLLRPAAWIAMEAAGSLPDPLATQAAAARYRLQIPATGRGLDEQLPASPVPTVFPESDGANRAYIAFTSGSTGRPRAIVGTHGPVSHFLDWYERTFAATSADRTSVLSGLGHDPLFRDVFAPIWSGGTAVMPDSERILEPGWLSSWMRGEAITVAHVTPPMAELVLQGSAAGALSSLRAVFFGGDLLQTELVRRFQAAAPNASFVNFYGATETPQAMGFHRVNPGSSRPAVPAGTGIDDVQLLVLPETGLLAGVGELGEINVRTPYLAAGYYGEDDETAARFIVNPFTGSAADRMYRTGDWGRYLPDGAVEFAGRRDFQVKIRGYRIELSEIDHAICQHLGVANAVSVVAGNEFGEPQIITYVVQRGGRIADASLRAHLRKHLPDYMQPAVLQHIDALPLTANGKIDRRALPPPDRQPTIGGARIDVAQVEAALSTHPAVDRAVAIVEQDQSGEGRLVVYVTYRPGGDATASELRRHVRSELPDQSAPALFVALESLPMNDSGNVDRAALPSPFGATRHAERVRPRTANEQLIASIWEDVLGVADISVHDNFFDVGGHSLLTVQVVARLEKRVGVRINPRLLVVETVEQLAARCDREDAGRMAPGVVGGAEGS